MEWDREEKREKEKKKNNYYANSARSEGKPQLV